MDIGGGNEPGLRHRNTVVVDEALVEAGFHLRMAGDRCDIVGAAFRFEVGKFVIIRVGGDRRFDSQVEVEEFDEFYAFSASRTENPWMLLLGL